MLRLLIVLFFFFFNDTATTEIYTLSLHDALPISTSIWRAAVPCIASAMTARETCRGLEEVAAMPVNAANIFARSEEHTSELQSHVNLVCRLLLEKKKKKKSKINRSDHNRPITHRH